MARGLRSKPGQADHAQDEIAYEIPGLDFSQTLTWRPGKAIAVADLLSRLKDLHSKLTSHDDDNVDSRQWTALAGDLANSNLLGHKDKGVRASTVSCIVDVLRICAPDAPFQDNQLKDIFNVIINSILPALANPTNAYNAEHVYILSSLSETQSILLLADVDSPDALLTALFSHSFDIFSDGANGTDMEISKSVEYHLKNLLSLVVDEVDLPQEVTDIIISQFMRVDMRRSQASTKSRKSDAQDTSQGNLLLKDYPTAYNIAKSICTTCQEKMTSQITHYFNAVILDASSHADANGYSAHRRTSGLNSDGDDEGLGDLRKAHRLLRELWRACPDVIVNVVPQIEQELSADSIELRSLATETLGDLAAGIGLAGLPTSDGSDPAAWPASSIDQPEPSSTQQNPLLTPAAPKPFAAVHRTTYESFLSRRLDRSPQVREAWIEAAARILYTKAGGIGMSETEQATLLAGYVGLLRDLDERVRGAAVRALRRFDYHGAILQLAADGGLSKTDTIYSAIAERFFDKKFSVCEDSIYLACRIWGAASNDIQHGNEAVQNAVGELAGRALGAYFTGDRRVQDVVFKAMHECLIPISFPQTKSAAPNKRKSKSDAAGSQDSGTTDPDTIRAGRILTMVNTLTEKPRRVFFALQSRQTQIGVGVGKFLEACEAYNGGVVDGEKDEATIKTELKTYIDGLSPTFPDPARAGADLWKLAKLHDRRNYQLIRFATAPESDYKTVTKAIKELLKRLNEGASGAQGIVEIMQALLYRCALLVYNRSHVPTIMEIARTDQYGLGATAHEILGEISERNPEVLKSHIQALCSELEDTVPSATQFEESGAASTLKACAHYARKSPKEVSKERRFLTALTSFAMYSKSPKAAKHAVSIMLTISDRKEMYAKDILSRALKDCRYGSPNYLSRLAAIAQVCKLAPAAANNEDEALTKLTVEDTLQKNRSPNSSEDTNAWDATPDEETQAKELCLKVLVNRCRAERIDDDREEYEQLTSTVYDILLNLVKDNGEMTPSQDTPPAQRNRLRLAAARLILKLCAHKPDRFEELTTPANFNTLALIVINPPHPVRSGFVNQIKQYLGRDHLGPRWFVILFLLAYEPDDELRNGTVKWIKSQVKRHGDRQQKSKAGSKWHNRNTMEMVFARLLSLMAHHPDYPQEDESFDEELVDFSRYIVFYLVCVANDENLSLIFHIAQRVKQSRDNIKADGEHNQRLYVLSDLAQTVIRNYVDTLPSHGKGSNLLQTWPGKVGLPSAIFRAMPTHSEAQKIAEKNYLPEDTALGLDKRVRIMIKELKGIKPVRRPAQASNDKKRKSDSVEPDELSEKPKKRKKSSLPIRKSPKVKRKSSPGLKEEHEPSRKSARTSNAISYVEADSDEDEDEEMQDAQPSSSPTVPRTQSRKRAASPMEEEIEVATPDPDEDGDEVMADDNGDVHVHEDEDAEAEAESGEEGNLEGTPTPSPLKERENTPGPPPSPEKTKNGKRGMGKGKKVLVSPKSTSKSAKTAKGKVSSAKKAKAPIPAMEENVRSTRTTRRSRG